MKTGEKELGDEKGHWRGPHVLTKGCGSRTTAPSSRLTLTRVWKWITLGFRDKVFHSSYQRGLHLPMDYSGLQFIELEGSTTDCSCCLCLSLP